ncbi:hypothetical protein Gotur_029293 [Gossypium turneri]
MNGYKFNLHNSSSIFGEVSWSSLFGLLIWRIWKNQNLFLFQRATWSAHEIIKVSYTWAKQFASFHRKNLTKQQEPRLITLMPDRWIQLCTDGEIKVDSGYAAAGGILRHGNGVWIMGFNRYLGACLIFDIELWGILDGLTLIQDSSFADVIIQMDSLKVVKAIQDTSSMALNSALIRQIHHLLANVGPWAIQHIPKEFNKSADCIAKLALDTRQSLKVFKEILRDVLVISPVVAVSGNLAQKNFDVT